MDENTAIAVNAEESNLQTRDDSRYLEAATSDNTRKAYQSDIQSYVDRGGSLPATPESIERYLRHCIEHQSNKTGEALNPNTLVRRVTAIRQWHKVQGYPDPGKSPLVKKTLEGMKRLCGKPAQKVVALSIKQVEHMAVHLNSLKELTAIRNKALLLVGYCGALRRSELVSLQWEQVEFQEKGMRLYLGRSKTDQTAKGEVIPIPVWPETRCAVRALIAWRQASGQLEGPVFRRLSKYGKVLEAPISDRHWSRVIKGLAEAVGIENADKVSGHSQRGGVTTEVARAGASLESIMRLGRWKCPKTAVGYIAAGRQFEDSALNLLFSEKNKHPE